MHWLWRGRGGRLKRRRVAARPLNGKLVGVWRGEVGLPAVQQRRNRQARKNHGQSEQQELARVAQRAIPLDAPAARAIDDRCLQKEKDYRRAGSEEQRQQRLSA